MFIFNNLGLIFAESNLGDDAHWSIIVRASDRGQFRWRGEAAIAKSDLACVVWSPVDRGPVAHGAPAFERLCEAKRLHRDGHTGRDAALQACRDAYRIDLGRAASTSAR